MPNTDVALPNQAHEGEGSQPVPMATPSQSIPTPEQAEAPPLVSSTVSAIPPAAPPIPTSAASDALAFGSVQSPRMVSARADQPASDGESLKELNLSIAEITSRITVQRHRQLIVLAVSMVFVLMGIAFSIFGNSFTTFINPSDINASAIIIIAIGISLATVGWFILQANSTSLQGDLDLLIAKRRIAIDFSNNSSTQPTDSYFDSLVRINIENLAAYYGLIKEQTQNSFLVSIVAGIIGFLLIIIGLALGLVSDSTSPTMAYVSAASGVITEFIAGIFFYLYNKTVLQLKMYHDSLLKVQNILLSFKIIGDTSDPTARTTMTSQMIAYIAANELVAPSVSNTSSSNRS